MATVKEICVRRASSGAAVLFGVWITWEIVYPVVRRLIVEGDWESESLSFLLVLPMMLLPGIVLTVSGIRLYRALDIESLEWVFGAAAVVGAVCAASALSDLLPGVLPKRIETTAYMLLSSLIALATYIAVLGATLRCFQLARPNAEPLVGRLALMLIAFQIWLLLSGIFREYSPDKEGYTQVPEEPWGTLGFVVPIFVAYGRIPDGNSLASQTTTGRARGRCVGLEARGPALNRSRNTESRHRCAIQSPTSEDDLVNSMNFPVSWNLAIAAGLLALTGCANTKPSRNHSLDSVNLAVYRINQLTPAGWEVAERESNVVPPGLLNRNGGEYIVLRGPCYHTKPRAAGSFHPPGLSVGRENLHVWIMPQPFAPKRPGLVQLLQLALIPTQPSFSAANEKIHVYAEGNGISSWRQWPQDLIEGFHVEPERP